jgi:hypothetical protein
LASAVGSIVLLCLLAAVAERGCRRVVAESFLPTGRAEWIWAAGAAETGRPIAFYAARDFSLAAPLPASVELRIAADEEYLVWINGMLVGSNRGDARPRLDRYGVERMLRVGGNRMLVEARSSWGAGGLLAALAVAGEEEPRVVTDESWTIYRVHRLGLVRGQWPLAGGERPQVWSLPPTGRWRFPSPTGVVEVASPEPPRWKVLAPRRVTRQPVSPDGRPGLVFDFGREVVGTLRLELLREGAVAGKLWVASDPLRLYDALPVARPQSVPGRGSWQDSVPRRFRYAAFSGEAQVAVVQVLLAEGRQPYEVPPVEGLFGIHPPRPRGGWMLPSSRTPVEHEGGGGL